MAARAPDDIPRPSRRLTGNLAAGATVANATTYWEVVPIRGSARVKVRAKLTTTGTLDLVFLGPDFDSAQAAGTAYASLTGTQYATGAPAQVALSANTEAQISADCYGESFALVKIVGSGAGAVTFVDVAQV